ncbi:Forkhead box protein Q1 [Holothuria leucospilota]|uniref:Forkhead box protein Q1 n=1 Tax=Holothuria leucospilota TaxID=206669 RepID=A0A9Q1CA12_HOLLE|nr:Forkhead box protein Q1 [Holothuria leucospilota]
MENRDENCLPSRRSTKGTRRPSYIRRIKPPYSYTELIRHAILASPERALTLRQIVACLQNRFACFCGPYQGWRNSIRHNLSANSCFVKILRDFSKPNGKDNFWTVNENCTCGQCTKGMKQSAVSTVGLPGPYFVDISNFRPLNDISQFGQVPEFPSIVQSPYESENDAENSPPLQTDVDPVQDNPKGNPTDTATKTADENNNGAADACQKSDGGTSLGVSIYILKVFLSFAGNPRHGHFQRIC